MGKGITNEELRLCLLVLCEPYQVTCCDYSYCKACIAQVKADKDPCPCCKNDLFDDCLNTYSPITAAHTYQITTHVYIRNFTVILKGKPHKTPRCMYC